MVQPFWKSFTVSIKFKIQLLYEQAIPFLSIFPRKMKIYVYAKFCKGMIIAILFIISKNSSAIKGSKLLIYTTWINHKGTIAE